MPEILNLKERYPCTCTACGAEIYVAPSISMLHGRNSGCGTCIKCNAFLHIEIAPDGERMVSQKWKEYLASKNIVPFKMEEAGRCSQNEQYQKRNGERVKQCKRLILL